MVQLASPTNDPQVVLHGIVSLCVCLDLFFVSTHSIFPVYVPRFGGQILYLHTKGLHMGGGRFLTPQMGTIFIGF